MATRKNYKKSKINRKKCGGKSKSMKQQKLWKMKGCSPIKLRRMQTGGDCGCGAPMLLQSGGSCGSCGVQMPLLTQGGGGVSLQTHVGSSWTPAIGGWPGVKGDNSGSWLAYNNRNFDPQTQGVISERDYQFTNGKPNPTFFGGSKKSKQSKKSKKNKKSGNLKGGSLIGNLYQNVKFGVGSAYNTLNGYPAPVNPRPYVQDNLVKSPFRNF